MVKLLASAALLIVAIGTSPGQSQVSPATDPAARSVPATVSTPLDVQKKEWFERAVEDFLQSH